MSDLTEWIKKGYENGKTKQELNKILIGAGWDINNVNKAFNDIEIEQELLADRFIKNSYSNTPLPPVTIDLEQAKPITYDKQSLDIKIPKIRNPFIKKDNSKALKCPKCGLEMVSEDVKEFILKELEAINNG